MSGIGYCIVKCHIVNQACVLFLSCCCFKQNKKIYFEADSLIQRM